MKVKIIERGKYENSFKVEFASGKSWFYSTGKDMKTPLQVGAYYDITVEKGQTGAGKDYQFIKSAIPFVQSAQPVIEQQFKTAQSAITEPTREYWEQKEKKKSDHIDLLNYRTAATEWIIIAHPEIKEYNEFNHLLKNMIADYFKDKIDAEIKNEVEPNNTEDLKNIPF